MLSDEQLRVVESNDDRILVIAGAGSGKTHCMIERICRLVDDGVDPSSILVLTFTNAAAFEMRERYSKRHPAGVSPELRTFHSFCYSIISTNKSICLELGFSSVPSIATEEDDKRIQKEAEMQTGIHMTAKQLSGSIALSPSQQMNFNILSKAKKRIMKQRNLITFDELCYGVCQLFESDSELIQFYRSKYKYIMVDEFQDTDDKQWRFVKSFQDSKLFVIGDALQALYAFRGADSTIIKNLVDDPNWNTYKLTNNYRSTKCICEFANDITTYANDKYRIALHSDKTGGFVRIVKGDINDVIDSLKLMDQDSSVAILARTNAEVQEISDVLKQHNVPHNVGRKDDTPLKILKSVTDNDYMVRWLASLLSSAEYADYIRKSFESSYEVKEFLNDFVIDRNKFLEALVQDVISIRRICKSAAPNISKFADILKVLKLENCVLDGTVDSLYTLYTYLESYLECNDSNVYVGTIHSVKGLEYNGVIVVGVNGSRFKLTNEENCNVYYVGVTRAKTQLVIISSL